MELMGGGSYLERAGLGLAGIDRSLVGRRWDLWEEKDCLVCHETRSSAMSAFIPLNVSPLPLFALRVPGGTNP